MQACHEHTDSNSNYQCSRNPCPDLHWWDSHTTSPRYPDWLEYCRQIETRPKPRINYLLTFTRNPEVTRSDWFDVVCHSLSSKQIEVVNLTAEHLSTNVHVHAHVTSKNNLSKDKFKAFTAKHQMDVKKIVKDNGIDFYFKKENKAFNNLPDFISYYKEKI